MAGAAKQGIGSMHSVVIIVDKNVTLIGETQNLKDS